MTQGSRVSALNWSEILQKMLVARVNVFGLTGELQELGISVVPFDASDAQLAAELWPRARSLSLADRACLALGMRLNAPVLTADRAWADLDIGVNVRLIR
jgi:ribonuclease VapC